MNQKLSIPAVIFALILFSAMTVLPLSARKDDMKEAQSQAMKASHVFQEIMDTPDKGIPNDLLNGANCVAVFPSVVKAAFIIGGAGGKGMVSCREEETGTWGPPVFLRIGSGSVGFQIGGQATDVVLVGMNRDSAKVFTRDRFELGGDISV